MQEGTSLGEWIRRRRRTLGLTQAELAAKTACAPITIRKIEAGERRPSRSVAECLAAALELDPGGTDQFVTAARTWLAPADSDLVVAGPAFGRSAIPSPRSGLVGRETELAEMFGVLSLAGGPARLLTITGAPGVGKTRVAVDLAARIERKLDVEAIWIDLSGLAEASDVIGTIAAAVAPPAVQGASVVDLAVHELQKRPSLLVIDNFEHVIGAGPEVGALLERCAELGVVVTSRVPLDVYGEHECGLQPLPAAAAVALFFERGREVRAGLDDNRHLESTRDICRQLDGLPLAIELAALRLRDFEPDVLASHLESGLAVLGANRRDRTARHHSVIDAVAWSYRLLEPADQQLLDSAGVFAGPFGVDALSLVADLDAGAGLRHLADHGLVTPVAPSRYALLAIVREFALAKLEELDSAAGARDRHARLVADLADAVSPGISAWPELAALDGIDALTADVQAALTWCFRPDGDPALGLRILLAAVPCWHIRGRLTDCVSWSTVALEALPQSYIAQYLAATSRWAAGDVSDRVVELLSDATRGARDAGDANWFAECLGLEQTLALSRGELERAASLTPMCVDAADAAGAEWQGLAHLRAGRLAIMRGDLDDASRHDAITTAVYDEIGSTWGRSSSAGLRGDVCAARGETAGAFAAYLDSIELSVSIGATQMASTRVASIACRLAEQGRWEHAAIVFGMVDGWLDELGCPLHPLGRLESVHWRSATQSALGADFAASLADGRAQPRTLQRLRELVADPS